MTELAFAVVGVKVAHRRRGSARRLPCRDLKSSLALAALPASPAPSDNPFMIATVPAATRPETSRASLDYLLLGDLRLLLEERACPQRDRWLLATLDMLLMSRPRSGPSIYLPTLAEESGRGSAAGRFTVSGPVPFDTLQRLRDRIVHRAPSDALVLELKRDLCEWAESLMMLAPMSAPACAG